MLAKFEDDPELPGADVLSILKGNDSGSRLTEEEQKKLIDVFTEHGKDWKKIIPLLPNRSRSQVCSFV